MYTQYDGSIFHIHKHTCVAIHEGTYPFPEANKIHDLQALFLESLSQFLGACCSFEAAQSHGSSPQLPVPGQDHRDAKGQQHLQANPTATASSGERRNYFAPVTSVFILLSDSVCLQIYHSTATRCKSMCSNWVACGRFSCFMSGEQPAQRLFGTSWMLLLIHNTP